MARVVGKTKLRVLLYRQIGMLLRSGHALREALLLVTDYPSRALAGPLATIKSQLTAGSDPRTVIAGSPQLFPGFPVDMLHQEMTSSALGQFFYEFAAQQERVGDMRRRMLRAFIYPTIVLSICLFILSVIMVFVIPQFEKMYADFGGSLPVPTRMLINLSDHGGSLVLVGFILAAVVVIILLKNPIALFPLGVRLPFLGGVLRQISIYLLTRQLAAFLVAGIPLDAALRLCLDNLKSYPFTAGLSQLAAESVTVESLGAYFAENRYFPAILAQMVHVGGKGNDLAGVLGEFSDFYEKEIESNYFRLLVATETCSLLLVAFLVGSTIIALYLPIFGLSGAI